MRWASFVVLTGLTALYIGLRVAIGGVRIDGGRVEIINALRTYRLRVEDVAVFGFATDGLLAGHAELVRRDGSRLRITSIQTAPTGGFGAPEAVQRLNAALEASRP